MKAWADLSAEDQLMLREAYGRDPDCQTGTCSLDAKMVRFSGWLAARGIAFDATDLPKRQPR